MELASSPSALRNRGPILDVLKNYLTDQMVLEIGSLTGEHVEFFAPALPQVTWQTSDEEPAAFNHIRIRLYHFENCLPPIKLEIGEDSIPDKYDVLYTANTFHIMAEWMVERFWQDIPSRVNMVLVYGPFKFEGEFTSSSNAEFDLHLKERGAYQGIRDFEKIQQWASDKGFELERNHVMPANNNLLVFKRI